MKKHLFLVEAVVGLITLVLGTSMWFRWLPKTVEEVGGTESDQTILRILTVVLSLVGMACGYWIAHWVSRKRLILKVISLVIAAVVTIALYLVTTVTRDAWSAVYGGHLVWTGIWIKGEVREAYPTLTHAQLLEEFGGQADKIWSPYSRLLGRLIPSTAFCFLLAFGVFAIVLTAELVATGTWEDD